MGGVYVRQELALAQIEVEQDETVKQGQTRAWVEVEAGAQTEGPQCTELPVPA